MGLFTPKTVPGACVKQWVRNEAQARHQLNAVPLNFNSEAGASFYEIYFPRPFQILGLIDNPLSNLPAFGSPPRWPNVVSVPSPPVQQATFSNLTPLLMLELALACMRPREPGVMYPVEYIEPSIQDIDYRGYFTHYLNDELMLTREQWMNTFMFPCSQWKYFADLNTGLTNIEWYDKFQKFVAYIKSIADQRMYGAPGLYRIQNAVSEWAFSVDTDYLFILES